MSDPHLWSADERGVTTVAAVGIILASLLFLGLVLATGDWWVHKRHLQAQADAAALAAAGDMAFPCTSDTVNKVNARISQYGSTLNPQVEGSQPSVHLVVNKPQYYNQSKADDTPDESPCDSQMIDVKATETDLRDIMGAGIVPFINAHARVQLFEATTFSGAIPIAVPDPTPKKVRAIFIDETNGSEIASAELSKDGVVNGNDVWDSGGDTIPVNIGSRGKIGVRIALGGASSTTCGQPLVECYDFDPKIGTDSDPGQKGLVYIHGYKGDGTVNPLKDAPIVRDANLTTTPPCPDAYFSVGVSCTVALVTKVDFGTGGVDPSTAPNVGGASASLRATVDGKTFYPLTWSNGVWSTTQTIPVPAAGGPVPIELQWARLAGKATDGTTACKTSGDPFKNNPCSGSLGIVQRSFSGNDTRSGPIQLVQVSSGGGSANSLRECDSLNTSCTYALNVSVALKGSLAVAKTINDPPVRLRLADQNRPYSLDCDNGSNTTLAEEMANGCKPTYTANTGTDCSTITTAALWQSPQPWQCVAVSTGADKNSPAAGLNLRILGDSKATVCHNLSDPNYGMNRYKVDFGVWDPDKDPRVVRLIVTSYGAFAGNGAGTIPVITFAQFYITGWSGQGSGFNNPCETTDIPSDPNLRDDDPGGGGFMVGHFIQYIDSLNSDTDQSNSCDPTGLTPCVAVLTR